MIRNCLIAAGNSGSPDLADSVEPHVTDENSVIAEAAHWALERLRKPLSPRSNSEVAG